ncbi:MAG: class I SAM-dependent methyltransferase [Candidatus Yanofskybacteria bacterium]|nr:class I SAM-dependent methyltransferase [Candidatus Yanofskybacteria bacterium]
MNSLKRLAKRLAKAVGLEVHRRRLHVWTTYPQAARFLYFQRLFDRVNQLDGDVMECGVGHGTSFAMLAFLARHENKGRHVWGFDSFVGYPEPTAEDLAGTRKPKKGEWAGTTVGDIQQLFVDTRLDPPFVQSNVHVIPGYFQDSLSAFTGSSIAFLHLDVNLHASYRTCLEQLYPKVVQGGVILFDEYEGGMEFTKLPGAKRAIDEYLAPLGEIVQRDPVADKCYLVKKNPREA